jgi:hypothetical protein
MRENRPSGLEGGARFNSSFLPLSGASAEARGGRGGFKVAADRNVRAPAVFFGPVRPKKIIAHLLTN